MFLLLLLLSISCPVLVQEVPTFLLSRKDIVDKTLEAAETVLSARDFENIPEREVDLRRLGIRVDSDPTMGNKVEGDIAGWSAEEVGEGAREEKAEGRGAEGREAGQPGRLFDQNGPARSSIRQPYRRWPQNEIPYALSSQYGSYSRSVIAKAMSEYHSKTCVRFVPRDPRKHSDFVWIHADDGCYSLVGRTGGRQPLSLDSGCIQVGTIVHELMHAVGFFHEQSRYDRDGYIQILWANVLRGADDQFEKYSFNTIDQLGEPYDYGSIMHYGPYAFSANGKRTIVPRRSGAHRMGQRMAFSDIDLRKINKLYQCDRQWARGETKMANGERAMNGTEGTERQRQIKSGVDPTVGANNDCEDRNWRCLFWAMPVFRHCARSESIRLRICPFSCGTCTRRKSGEEEGGGGQCADKSAMCGQSISREGLCSGLMGKLFCPKTCGECRRNGWTMK